MHVSASSPDPIQDVHQLENQQSISIEYSTAACLVRCYSLKSGPPGVESRLDTAHSMFWTMYGILTAHQWVLAHGIRVDGSKEAPEGEVSDGFPGHVATACKINRRTEVSSGGFRIRLFHPLDGRSRNALKQISSVAVCESLHTRQQGTIVQHKSGSGWLQQQTKLLKKDQPTNQMNAVLLSVERCANACFRCVI
jgi:hypothetical protein